MNFLGIYKKKRKTMKTEKVKFYLKKYKDGTGLIVAHFNFRNCRDGRWIGMM